MIEASVLGIGAWAPGLAGWPAWRAGTRTPAASAATRPVATLLPAAERRRAPDGVSVALSVAHEAVTMAGAHGNVVDVRTLPTVFASAFGDLAIVDYLCASLASDPLALSPTRFHHSVHNAAAGYWSIATGATEAATAIAAGPATFANGLLEALVQVATRSTPVLLVAFDTPATGPLVRAAPNAALFGCAFVFAPRDDASTGIAVTVGPGASERVVPRRDARRAPALPSPSAAAMAFLDALADGCDATIDYALGPAATLRTRVTAPALRAQRVG